MAATSLSLTLKSPLLSRFLGFSRKPISHTGRQIRTPANQAQITAFRGCSSFSLTSYTSSFGQGTVVKDLGGSKIRFGQLGFGRVRVSAVSDGGSGGGTGGGSGGSGDGNSGGRSEGGSGGSNWSFLQWYLALLAKYPVATKAVTSALLTLIGDLICQLTVEQVPSLDLKRTFLFTLLGLVLVGPTLHFWYSHLNKMVTMTGASGAFLRLLTDQFLFSPIFIGVFLSTLVTLEGRPSEVLPKLQQEWFSSVVANWQLWIPFQFLNFRFVPPQFQVLAANVIALAWNVILSFKAHKEILQK
ncbi:peroxisomal membrane 22 kDa (Mpv17/PMP22) family protein [Citrus sinensis]|uniref:Peroxisomal membrane 22 kDa (Mpv17/PMP22) family protein n=1 Tax=Citrus sinensis TaxID=2711 RepID=A0ACB8K1F8_CITSI|nr:peroxisomal membrane 22 kDa (Mpv17/PMP22) family protein [Citrus sinensis]